MHGRSELQLVLEPRTTINDDCLLDLGVPARQVRLRVTVLCELLELIKEEMLSVSGGFAELLYKAISALFGLAFLGKAVTFQA